MTSTRKPSSKKTPRSSGPAGPSYPAPIQDTALNAAQRERALEEMSSAEGLDVLVVGGGVTGAGIALDAAARGLRTGIVEMGDWASGTSSWSSGSSLRSQGPEAAASSRASSPRSRPRTDSSESVVASSRRRENSPMGIS